MLRQENPTTPSVKRGRHAVSALEKFKSQRLRTVDLEVLELQLVLTGSEP